MSRIERVEGNLYEFSLPPDDEAMKRAIADSLFKQGLDAEEQDDLDLAFSLFQQSLSYNPCAAGTWANLGTIWLSRRSLASAEECYRKALDLEPEFALAHYNLANVLDEMNRMEEALGHYIEAINADPRHGDAHHNLACIYERLHLPRQAMKHYREYLQCAGGNEVGVYLSTIRHKIRALQGLDLTIIPKPAASEGSSEESGQAVLWK